jgi:hypothetical protein
MTPLVCVGAAVLVLNLSACSIETVLHGLSTPQTQQAALPDSPPQPAKAVVVAQAAQPGKPAHRAKKPDPKPEPTQQELFDYLRGKLLSLSPDDGLNDNLEVSFDPATSIMSITQPDGHCDVWLNAIDPNTTSWDKLDPSDTYHTREQVLRLTLTSLSGKKARTCYNKRNEINTEAAANRARLLFSLSGANAIPDFIETMEKTIKKLVTLSSRAPDKSFSGSSPSPASAGAKSQ